MPEIQNDPASVAAAEEESRLERWSRRKLAARSEVTEPASTAETAPSSQHADTLTDADMPAVESLDERCDVSGFFSPGVSDELRQLALRKLFHLPKFNVCDGLDDYADDYTSFEPLGEVITADMRHRLELAAQRAREVLSDELSGTNTEPTEAKVVANTSPDDDTTETALEDERHERG